MTSSSSSSSSSDIFRLPRAIGYRDHLIGAFLAALYVAWLLATARSLGFPRDESFYFQAGSTYARWFDLLFTKPSVAIKQNAVDGAWGTNHEHPALMKSLFGLSWLFFHEKWKLFSAASTAFRFPAMVMSGAALWITYLFGARAFSRRAGLVAAILLGLMPHVFFHAHLACFDVPIMTMWLLSVYVYWRSVKVGGWGWAIAAGLVYGLTLETKHNAWILPAVFIPHALMVHGGAIARGAKAKLPGALIAMAILGPLVFVALWPWMWFDTAERVKEYMNFHLNHEYYNIEYLGKNYFGPPSPKSYAPFLIVATVPTITLLLFVLGAGDRARSEWARIRRWIRRRREEKDASPDATELSPKQPSERTETDLLLALAFAAPLAVFFLPKTPIFGGTKHWITAYPFLAILAGQGFDVASRWMEKATFKWPALQQRVALWALGAACIAAPLAITRHSHPFGISAYVPIVGGYAGGADLGLNRQFWGYTTQDVGPWLAENAPRGASVFIHDTTWDAWSRMQEEGRIRRDLHASGSPGDANFALVQHELHMNEVDYDIWVAYGSPAPAYVLTHDGVPVVSVYRRP